MTDLPATIGRYRIERQLGQGGMGRVLLAEDQVLGRKVAVKVLRDDLALPPEVKDELFARMRVEARAAAAVAHPNLVTLHDMGEDPALGVYLVFELVDGPSLRDRIGQGPVDALEVARIALEIGSALGAAHEAGVIHRDVKPENVLLAKTGAKLADFGVARLPDSALTRAGAMLGTPCYSAPEALARGEFSPASDQFSLAATIYEALSGKRAYGGDDALAVAGRIAAGPPPPLAEQFDDPRERVRMMRVDAALARGFATDPKKRYASCRALGEGVAAAIDARISSALPVITASHSVSIVPRQTRRMQNLFAGAAVLVILALVLFGRRGGRQEPMADAGATVVTLPATVAPPQARPRPRPSAAPQPAADAGADASEPPIALPQRF
jgi:serine/threonine-protein kinase